MRILILASRDGAHPEAAGGDLHLTQLGRDLASLGHEVTFLAASSPNLPRVEQHGRLRILRVAPPRLLFPCVWARLATDLHARHDVVIEEAIGGERAAFLARFLSGTPTVQFWYQDNRPLFAAAYGPGGRVVGGLLQALLLRGNRSGYALTSSYASRKWLLSRGFRPERVAVSYPKVNVGDAPPEPRPFDARRNRMIIIGNFRRTKRFEEGIRVLALVRRTIPSAELSLIGKPQDSDYLEELRQLAESTGGSGAVSVHLAVTDAEKFRLLSEAKVLTIHSPVEGFGWTIPEAGLCGVPVVGNPGIPTEVLRDSVNGTRVPFGDPTAYAAAVVGLMSNAPEWTRLSAGARSVALEFVEGQVEPDVIRVLHEGAKFSGQATKRPAAA